MRQPFPSCLCEVLEQDPQGEDSSASLLSQTPKDPTCFVLCSAGLCPTLICNFPIGGFTLPTTPSETSLHHRDKELLKEIQLSCTLFFFRNFYS